MVDAGGNVLAEANAIGTAWLRAKAIGQPRGDEIARLLEQYTNLRKDFVQAPPDPAVLDDINNRTNALQSAIWEQVSAIVREQPNPISASLMASLNEVFDMTTAARFAFELRLPPQIFWLLIGLSLLGMGYAGLSIGPQGITDLRSGGAARSDMDRRDRRHPGYGGFADRLFAHQPRRL